MSRTLLQFLCCVALVSALFVSSAGAADTASRTPARVSVAKVTGQAFVFSTDYALRLPIETGAFLQQGQTIVTEKNSSLLLVMANGATVILGENGQLRIDEFVQSPFKQAQVMSTLKAEPSSSVTRLNLMRGEIISDVKKLNKGEGSSFLVKTPVGAAGIRGTAFRLAFIPKGNSADFSLVMAEGTIEFIFNADGKGVIVDRGRQLVIRDISFDAGSGKILGLPAGWKVEETAVNDLSKLLNNVQDLLKSVDTFTVAPSRTDTEEPEKATPSSFNEKLPSLPLSGLIPSGDSIAPRTSPTEGRESL